MFGHTEFHSFTRKMWQDKHFGRMSTFAYTNSQKKYTNHVTWSCGSSFKARPHLIFWHARRHKCHPSCFLVQGRGWRKKGSEGTESHGTEDSCIVSYTWLWRHFSPPAIQYFNPCIGSITKTHKRGHTPAHRHTNTPCWVTSKWANKAEKRLREQS